MSSTPSREAAALIRLDQTAGLPTAPNLLHKFFLYFFVRFFLAFFFFSLFGETLLRALCQPLWGARLGKTRQPSTKARRIELSVLSPVPPPSLCSVKKKSEKKKRSFASSLMWRRCRGAAGVRCPSSFFFFHPNPRQSSWHQSRVGINERSPVGVKWFCHSRRRLSTRNTRLPDALRVLMRLFRRWEMQHVWSREQSPGVFQTCGCRLKSKLFCECGPQKPQHLPVKYKKKKNKQAAGVKPWHLATFSANLVAIFCSLANMR